MEQDSRFLPAGYKLKDFTVKSVLGNGGFGVTYLAEDEMLGRKVAIKEYIPAQFSSRSEDATVRTLSAETSQFFQTGMEKFLQEAQILARFSDPGIVRVISFFRHNETAYMVMEFEEGKELNEMLKEGKATLSEEYLLGMLVTLLEGLEKIHEQNILHRDIKPANVFIRNDGSPILLDFGSAHDLEEKKGVSFVTHGFSPMEQYVRIEAQGPWTDIYALGAFLYNLITGEKPPKAPLRAATRKENQRDPFIPSVERCKGRYSPRFLTAIDQALAFLPRQRPQKIAQWREMFVGKEYHKSALFAGQKVFLDNVSPQVDGLLIGLGWDSKHKTPEAKEDNDPNKKVSLDKSAPSLKQRFFGGRPYDLDASVFMLGKGGRVQTNQDLIFYNRLNSKCGGIRHLGDNLTGDGEGDDEEIEVTLSTLPDWVEKLVFTVTIYRGQRRKQNFGEIENAFIRLVNRQNNNELLRYDLTGDHSHETGLVFGELYRFKGRWKFGAVGRSVEGGLRSLAENYGVGVTG